jgi:hypothetical protein
MDDIQKTTLRIDTALHEEVRVAIARRRAKTFQEAVNEALKLWLAAPVGQPVVQSAQPAKGFPYPETREWHEMLEAILRHGTERQQLGIQSNLEAFVGNLPAARPTKKAKAS